MTIELELQKPHPAQQEFLNNRVKFNVLKCGRRWGKTTVCSELFLEGFEGKFITGYFTPTYKDLAEVWKETYQNFYQVIARKDETLKELHFINGARIDFWSMEDPNSGRGRKYHRAIMDECEKALKFQQAWEQAIAPTLTDYGGDAYFLSTPKLGPSYFKEKICKNQHVHPELWRTFIYTTYDNPTIPKHEIDLMRSILEEVIFNCEYLAEDLDGISPSPFAHHYDRNIHVGDAAVFNPNRRIVMSVDFNLQPFAASFSHIWEDEKGYHDHTFDEIEIQQGSIDAMAEEVRLRFGKHLHKMEITGDYMGMRGDMGQRDNASYYEQLLKMLGLTKHALKTAPNPTHENSKGDFNYFLYLTKQPNKKWEYLIHPNCKKTIFDLENVQWDALKGEIVKRNRKDAAQRGDFIDGQRYKINTYWKKLLKRI